ncbi:NADP(H)-dependent aldo-keto reductase [Defluviicoccus vanus]|uniref:Protein tas n=1 Tax=Defluviicoccus vanus TaxID=111831 RepID=A0A7H1N6L5_9PROT|nr:NADP(H)-dependent aldo-keto reductase [Defluviicoccus vanus]QNT71351.1 NADP(H)-dependent aldo-keto reductase [Defluviicoccus vanus]
MHYQALGRTGLKVSRICLGTMTFGEQNSADEACRMLDFAVAGGVNFLDTAEMYPIPPRATTAGATELIIGDWLRQRGGRDRLVIATKIAGPGLQHLQRRPSAFTRDAIRSAIDGSLRRLQTDYIDLYQLHWPERKANFFGQLGYRYDASDAFTPFAEVLAALAAEIADGRIRAIGVSNETPWGLMRMLALAEAEGLPRLAGIQNPYNLLNRSFEVGLAEVALREDCGLLAYSPLAFGTLSGKYLNGEPLTAARLTLFPQYCRYTGARAVAATGDYCAIARRCGYDPAQMALAAVIRQPFVTATIIGATTLSQLATNLAAETLELSPDALAAIEAVHVDNPNPAP